MSVKLWKVGFLGSSFMAAGCSFLAHDPLSPPHMRRAACATQNVVAACEEKLSPEYQTWLTDVKHFCRDTQQEFADEYHRNNDWPLPYSTLAERSARDPFETQAANARYHLTTLWDYHFDQGTWRLNSMGRKRLQDIISQVETLGRVVYVQRSVSSTETELRLEQVRNEIDRIDTEDHDFEVAQARTTPTLVSGEEARITMDRLTRPQKGDTLSTSNSGSGNEYKSGNSGGSGSGSQ